MPTRPARRRRATECATAHVPGPHARGQPVGAVVGQRDGLSMSENGMTPSTGPKISSAHHRHATGRRRRARWARRSSRRRRSGTAADHGGAVVAAAADVIGDALELLLRDQRADVGARVRGRSRPYARPASATPVHDLARRRRLVDEQAGAGGAHLAGVPEHRAGDAPGIAGDGRRRQDDHRRLAAQLQARASSCCRSAAVAMIRPTSVDPVKATMSTSGCRP